MINNPRSKSKAAAAAILGLCLIAFVMFDEKSYTSQYLGRAGGRRSLQEMVRLVEGEWGSKEPDMGVYSWAQSSLVPLSAAPNRDREIPLFWHMPKVS